MASTYDSEGATKPQSALIEMLRANTSKCGKRVFPPDVRQDAAMPRVTVAALSPTERRTGIGEHFGTGMGLFYNYPFKIDVWDRDAAQIDIVANEVLYAIWKNRGYTPTDSTSGYFILIEATGGSEVTYNAGKQLYQRTINARSIWLTKTTNNF